MSHASVVERSGDLSQLKLDILGDHQSQSLTFADMEVACHLVTGPVYLAGETITCRVSVVNNATTSKVFVGHNVDVGCIWRNCNMMSSL